MRLVVPALLLTLSLGLTGCLGSNDITGDVLLYSETKVAAQSRVSPNVIRPSVPQEWIIENELVVSFELPDAAVCADAALAPLGGRRALHSARFAGFSVYRFPGAAEVHKAGGRLALLPGIKRVEPNCRVVASSEEPVSIPETLWNYNRIQLPDSRTISAGSPEVIVAVLDTGFLLTHVDLADAWTEAKYDFVGKDDNPEADTPAVTHGTHVAGIIAARASAEMVGVAPNIRLMPIRVLDDNEQGDLATVAFGIRYAVDQGADIINLSLQSAGTLAVLNEAVSYAIDHGVTVVAAAGNTGDTSNPDVQYPARLDSVIAVGAVDANDKRAAFSSYGPELDLAAPGTQSYSASTDQGIYSTSIESGFVPGYGYRSGTSMAAAHVSGVAALLASCGIKSPQSIRSWLEGTATDLGPGGRDSRYGCGLVNAYAALALSQMRVSVRRVPGDGAPEAGVPATAPSPSGRFVLRNVPDGDWILWGWVDANGNGTVDPPDSYGEYAAPLLIPGTRYRDLPLIIGIKK